MSDLTLLGVLRLPIECWDESDDEFSKLDKVQRHARYLQAADRIEADAARIAELEAQLDQPAAVTDEPWPEVIFLDGLEYRLTQGERSYALISSSRTAPDNVIVSHSAALQGKGE